MTFRVSGEEYEQLYAFCVAKGARSISDFARAAVLHVIEVDQGRSLSLGGDLATLGSKLGELDKCLASLRERIAKMLGPGAETAAKND